MRILVISNLFPPEVLGGYELGCAQCVEGLLARGHDLRVLTSVSSHASSDFLVRRELQLAPVYNPERFGVSSLRAQQHAIADASFVNAANVHVLEQQLREFRPDVVYLWNLFGVGGLGLLGSLGHAGMPWVWHLMDSVPLFLCSLSAPNVAARERFPSLAREFAAFTEGDYIICSRRIEWEMRDAGIELSGSINLVPNWIVGERPLAHRSFFSGGHLRIVNAGQLGEHKGTDIIIETAARLLDRGYANFSIDIYGIGDEWPLRALANRLGVSDLVTFRQPAGQADLGRIYDDCDIFLFPTWPREPFGFAPLEAASRGCLPVISADCGLAEWLVDGVHCLKAGRDPDSFVEKLVLILDQRLDSEEVARCAEDVAWRDFHLNGVLPVLEGILSQAANRGRGPNGVGDFYAIARFAEGLVSVLIEEGSR